MLKRQRPASPPPSIPTIPLVDDSPFEMTAHQSKRRRLLPPILDGQVRGWGKIDHADGDDEDYEEHQEGSEGDTNPDGRLADTTGYKSVNGVLSELHALHRRRHFPSSSSNPQLSWLQPILPSCQAHDKNVTLAQSQSEFSVDLGTPEDVVPTDELLRVTERYEDTNRLLRSLFLSRRRQLGSPGNHATDS